MKNNDFLIIKLNQKNEFRTNASFEINGMKFSAVDVKIDTGCPHTSFPMLKLGLSEESAYKLKEQDCQNESVAKTISFGVNDTKTKTRRGQKKIQEQTLYGIEQHFIQTYGQRIFPWTVAAWRLSNFCKL